MVALKQRISDLSRYFIVTPVAVVVIVIGLSLVIAMLIDRGLDSSRDQSIEKVMKQNELAIKSELGSYAQIVWSGVGRINSGPVDRDSWQRFMSTYDIKKNFSAISQLSMTQIVTPDSELPITQALGQQYSRDIAVYLRNNSGLPPNIVTYMYPETQDSLNNVGFDLHSEALRSQALQQSTQSGEIVITDRLELIRNAQSDSRVTVPAFFMYAPYYDPGLPQSTPAERSAAIRGHVAAAFRAENVFKSATNLADKQHLTIRVSMGKQGNSKEMFVQQAKTPTGPKINKTQQLELYGQTFIIEYEFDRDYVVAASQQRAPLATVVFGVFVALLTGIVTFFFLRDRYHRVMFEKERDITHAKDELLSLASHQLRTPATGVKQYMGMVLQGFAGDITNVQRDFLTKAYKSNERQLHVINDILHLAKLDLGRIVLAKSEFDVSDMIRDVVEEQSQDMQSAQLSITLRLLKKAPIWADEHVLRMVVENIISNAIKYTDPDGKITVRLQRKDSMYELTVKDTGVGIAESDMPKLFKQFSRLTNARSHMVPGTGVGLYLAKHLTVIHGGDITVVSRVGKGSTFTVTIPILQKNL